MTTRRTKVTKVRLWRWRRSPLRRRSDSVEAWLVLVTWALALLGGVFGGLVTADSVEQGLSARRAEVRPVAALLTDNAADTPSAATFAGGGRVWANVRWTAPDGSTNTGQAKVEPGTRAGASATVWTDRTGRLVSEPATAAQAGQQAALVGSLAGLGVGTAVLFCGRLERGRLDRRRMKEWDDEWEQFGPQWRKRLLG